MQEIVAPRSKARNDARLAVTLIAYESRTGFAEEIRSFLGYRTASALRSAASRARKRADRDPTFQRLIAALRSQWAIETESLAS